MFGIIRRYFTKINKPRARLHNFKRVDYRPALGLSHFKCACGRGYNHASGRDETREAKTSENYANAVIGGYCPIVQEIP